MTENVAKEMRRLGVPNDAILALRDERVGL